MGLMAKRGPMAALLATCVAVGVGGMAWQADSSGLIIERRSPTAEAQQQTSQGKTMQVGEDMTPQEQDQQSAPSRVVVHVDGAVGAPGVVELEGVDVRVCDAVEAAGGLLEDADTSVINLAAPIADGVKVHVPSQDEQAITVAEDAVGTGAQPWEAGGVSGGLVNINTAGMDELQTLSGVGEATARAIIEDREQNGPFAAPEDLMRVSGIGEKKFAKVRESICV